MSKITQLGDFDNQNPYKRVIWKSFLKSLLNYEFLLGNNFFE